MSNNVKQPVSKIAKAKKLLLFPNDKLIGVLNPDLYIIVDPSTLTSSQITSIQNGEDPFVEDPTSEDPENTPESPDMSAPTLEDITLISKTLVTDGNKNQFVEFKFNIKNHVGDQVVGVNGYGQ
jgi:hypothetical protein